MGAGIMFAALGAGALIIAQNYEAGTFSRFGPGMVPRMVGWCLLVGGLIVIARSFVGEGARIEKWILRPNVFVLLSVVAFGLLIEHTGVIAAVIVMTAISRAAQSIYNARWVETIVIAIALAAVAVFGFVLALELPIPIWPS